MQSYIDKNLQRAGNKRDPYDAIQSINPSTLTNGIEAAI
jgi:hypothetical protein